MSTLNARILTPLLDPDFNVGIYRGADINLANVNPNDIDVLIENLNTFKDYLADVNEHRQQQAQKLLQELVQGSGMFSSVEDLIAAMGVTQPVQGQSKSKTTSNNDKHEVVLTDGASGERRSYVVTNKIITKKIQKDPVYIALTQKNPELLDTDEFLRAFSEDYRKQYPINAKWNGQEFYLNLKGSLNKKSSAFFDEYKKKYPKGTEQDFKELVQKAYKDA